MYPNNRNRRLRKSPAIRDLVRENELTTNDLMLPIFIAEGSQIKELIPSMPGCYRLSLDLLLKELKSVSDLGIKALLLFVKVDDALKDNKGTAAIAPDGLMQRAVKTIKDAFPDLLIMTDVALDPYSSYGHDGIVEAGNILNDPTVEVLSQMALSHALAGADFVAPSDMMDGRVAAIREALDDHGHELVSICSYTAKYASAFYGPFRGALGSAPKSGDKKTYQMDPGNSDEAIHEVALDLQEGADMVMVKPGMPYLDIVRRVKTELQVPTFAYQVSGEYAMHQAAFAQDWLSRDAVMLESLLCFRRAGADGILTYFAMDAARLLNA